MKSSFIKAVILISIFAFVSCKKSSNQPQSVTILGAWKYKSSHDVAYNAAGGVTGTYDQTTFAPGTYIKFNSDGTGAYYDGDPSGKPAQVFTYSVAGNVETETGYGLSTQQNNINLTSTSLSRHIKIVKQGGNYDLIDEELVR